MRKFLMIVAMGSVLCAAMTSCDGEEDDEKRGGFVTPTEEGDFDGTHLTSVVSEYDFTNFSYNGDGSLSQITYSYGDKVTLDYTNSTISFIEGDEPAMKGYFTTNGKGFITEISYSGSDDDEEWDVSYHFEYNNSDHITRATVYETSAYESEDGTNREEIIDVTWNFKWDGDLLLSFETIDKSIEPEDDDHNEGRASGKETNIFTYDVDNRYMQYTSNVIYSIDFDGDFEDFMYVGLFGKGPSKYPSKIEEVTDNGKSPEYFTYELNSKGLVERLSSGYVFGNISRTEEYSYDNISKSYAPTADNKAGVGRERHKKSRHHIGRFGRRN